MTVSTIIVINFNSVLCLSIEYPPLKLLNHLPVNLLVLPGAHVTNP